MKRFLFIACLTPILSTEGARVVWDTPPGSALVVYGTLVDPYFSPSTITTWPTPSNAFPGNYINFALTATVTGGGNASVSCIMTQTSNNGVCSNFPRPPSNCNSAEEAAAFFATMNGMRFRLTRYAVPTTGKVHLSCHSGKNPIGYMTGPQDIEVGPPPVSCVTTDLVLASSGTVGEADIRIYDRLEVACTDTATVRLELDGGGDVPMGGGVSARVSFGGDKARVTVNAVPNASIPVTARLLTPALSAGTYSGSIVLTTTVE